MHRDPKHCGQIQGRDPRRSQAPLPALAQLVRPVRAAALLAVFAGLFGVAEGARAEPAPLPGTPVTPWGPAQVQSTYPVPQPAAASPAPNAPPVVSVPQAAYPVPTQGSAPPPPSVASPPAATPLAPITPAFPSREPPTYPQPRTGNPSYGEVVEVDGVFVTVSLGADQGLGHGEHVAFPSRADGSNVEPDVEDVEGPLVVGEVVELGPDRARVQVGMLESVQVGTRAELTSVRISANRRAPLRAANLFILEAGLRPYMPLPRISVGAVADFAFTYLLTIPMYLRAELSPLAARVGRGSDSGSIGSMLSVGYDIRWLALGFGLGTVMHRSFVDDPAQEWEVSSRGRLGDATARMQIGQYLRLGSRDGLHIAVNPRLALTGDHWEFSSFTISGQVPRSTLAAFAPRVVLAPQVGLFVAELGMRKLVWGNGGANSLFLRPAAGVAAGFNSEKNDSHTSYVVKQGAALRNMLFGPMFGVDFEWRI
jgi:hypothetical protein